VHALFVLDAQLDAEGDVFVLKEIVQSKVTTRGIVEVKSGRIVGGEITALRGIEAGQVGTDANVATRLDIGNDPALQQRLRECQERLEPLEETCSKISQVVTPLLAHQEDVPTAKREAVEKLNAQLKGIQGEIEIVEQEIAGIHSKTVDRDKLQVVVHGVAYPETIFTVLTETLRVRKPQTGPLKAVVRDGRVRLLSLTQ
jgi:uncharacterized protein (DUF342 family)